MPSSRAAAALGSSASPVSERVVPVVCRLDEIVAGCARRHREAMHLVVAAPEDERWPLDHLLDARGEGRRAATGSIVQPRPTVPNVPTGHRADTRGELGVVAERRVRVERQVVGDERCLASEERLEPAAHARVHDERLVAPEEAVVDEHELRAEADRLARTGPASTRRRTRRS